MSEIYNTFADKILARETAITEQLKAYADAAITAGQGSVWFAGADKTDIKNPVAVEPPVYIPATATNQQWVSWMQDGGEQLINWLLDGSTSPSAKIGTLFNDYVSRFFPLSSDAYGNACAWLNKAITEGGTGLPAAIEQAIYQRDRDRRAQSMMQAQALLFDRGAASGAPCPPGAIFAQAQDLTLEWQRGNQGASTDLAVKSIEIEIANLKFAVELALKLRHEAMASAVNYIGAVISPGKDMLGMGALVGDRQSAMINAATNAFRARLEKDQLTIQAGTQRQHLTIENGHIASQMAMRNIESGVKAAVGAVNAFANALQAVFSALNSIAVTQESV